MNENSEVLFEQVCMEIEDDIFLLFLRRMSLLSDVTYLDRTLRRDNTEAPCSWYNYLYLLASDFLNSEDGYIWGFRNCLEHGDYYIRLEAIPLDQAGSTDAIFRVFTEADECWVIRFFFTENGEERICIHQESNLHIIQGMSDEAPASWDEVPECEPEPLYNGGWEAFHTEEKGLTGESLKHSEGECGGISDENDIPCDAWPGVDGKEFCITRGEPEFVDGTGAEDDLNDYMVQQEGGC